MVVKQILFVRSTYGVQNCGYYDRDHALATVILSCHPQANQRGFYLGLGLCHAVAMTSAFTNPVLYGWFNTQLKSELETLVPKRLRR